MHRASGTNQTYKAYFAGGCFWCTEAIFEMLRGVISVESGYVGGKMENPSYVAVSGGETGHAEAIEITFDPKIISYSDLLYVFFKTHDPTTLDQQGADVGNQYRSVVFYVDEDQKKVAKEAIELAQKDIKNKIVTELVKFDKFNKAEGYHQDYYKKNPNETYCRLVIDPKIQKLKANYSKFLK